MHDPLNPNNQERWRRLVDDVLRIQVAVLELALQHGRASYQEVKQRAMAALDDTQDSVVRQLLVDTMVTKTDWPVPPIPDSGGRPCVYSVVRRQVGGSVRGAARVVGVRPRTTC